MFVKNKASIDFNFRKGSYLVTLKAGTVTYVDENRVTARELIGCYGQRIDVISRDLVQETPSPVVVKERIKAAQAFKNEEKKIEAAPKKVEFSDSFIDKLLDEIKTEVDEEADDDVDSGEGDPATVAPVIDAPADEDGNKPDAPTDEDINTENGQTDLKEGEGTEDETEGETEGEGTEIKPANTPDVATKTKTTRTKSGKGRARRSRAKKAV